VGDLRYVEPVGPDGPDSQIYRCPLCGDYFRWGEATWREPQLIRRDQLDDMWERIRTNGGS